jgi:general secretion pathway protein A
LTGGIPRLINLVCDRALLGAYARERKQVDKTILHQAAREVLGELRPQGTGTRVVLAAGLAAVAVVFFAAGFWLLQPQSSATATAPPSSSIHPTQAAAVATPTEESELALVVQKPSEATTVAKTAAEAPEKPQDEVEILPQSWPSDFAAARSMDEAFADLAGLWGLSPPDGDVDYCAYAHENGLECLARRDSLEKLRTMNRPAILTLYGDDGEPFHVVMAGLGSDRAQFIAGEEQHELALAAIASRWFGEYLLLWQRPPLQQEFLRPGEAGESVKWLARTLQGLGLYEATGREKRLEGSLLGAFKHFQFSNGLTPDGILGPMTLIHLNTAGNQTGPRLDPRGTS